MVVKTKRSVPRRTFKPTPKPWVRSQWSGIKRKLEEGPDLPSGPREKLGRYTPVHPNQTTLSRALGPFTGKKYVELVYDQSPVLQTTTAPGTFLSVLCNSAFDFDVTGNLGNKQPLYYDSLLSASGPYKSYKVISWKTTWTFMNASAQPVNIYVSPPVAASSEVDIEGEVEDFPGVRKLSLTAESGSKSIGKITTKGHLRDVYPGLPYSTTFVAAYSGSPSSTCFQTVFYKNVDGASVTKLYVGVHHVMYCELGQLDAIVS